MASAAPPPLPMSASTSSPRSRAASSSQLSLLSAAHASSASIALTIGARHHQLLSSHTSASRPTAASATGSASAALLQYQQQQPLLLLRPQPSMPHVQPLPSPLAAAASLPSGPVPTSSSSSSLSSPAPPSAAAGVPFFVSTSSSASTALGGALTASAHSAFSFPSMTAPSSLVLAASPALSALSAPTSTSSGQLSSGGSTHKRISFISPSPLLPHAVPSFSPAGNASAAAFPRAAVSADDWQRLLQASASRVDKRAVSAVVLRWLVQEGYADVADCFEAEALLKADRPSAHIDERTAIRKLILGGDVAGAVSRCNALYPAMLDQPQHSPLAFMAQQQTLIELIREQHIERALAFARQEMAPRAQHQPPLMLELEKTMSLLAFAQPATQSPYAALLSQQRRQAVSSAFNAALLQQQQRQIVPSGSSSSASTYASTSPLQPAASDLVRLLQRLQYLQPQLACTHSYPTLTISCKPSAAITAVATAAQRSAEDSGAGADSASSAVSHRSNSVSVAAGSPSSAVLSPVASRTPVTMPMPSRSVARHQLPSPFSLSSATPPTVPPSPVSLSAHGSPSLSGFSPLSLSSASASSSRRSSLTHPSLFSLHSPVAPPTRPAPHGVTVVASVGGSGVGSSTSAGSGSGGRGSVGGESASSTHPVRRGRTHPSRNDDEDNDMAT